MKRLAVLLGVAVIAVAGCGGSDDQPDNEPPKEEIATEPAVDLTDAQADLIREVESEAIYARDLQAEAVKLYNDGSDLEKIMDTLLASTDAFRRSSEAVTKAENRHSLPPHIGLLLHEAIEFDSVTAHAISNAVYRAVQDDTFGMTELNPSITDRISESESRWQDESIQAVFEEANSR